MNMKTAEKSSENETQPFCNYFWSVSSHLACQVFICYPSWNPFDVNGLEIGQSSSV